MIHTNGLVFLVISSLAVTSYSTVQFRKSILPSNTRGSTMPAPLVDAEIDMILRDPSVAVKLPDTPACSARKVKQSLQGRPAVEAAVKAIQRFTLQRE
jgi:hypothetical protein